MFLGRPLALHEYLRVYRCEHVIFLVMGCVGSLRASLAIPNKDIE